MVRSYMPGSYEEALEMLAVNKLTILAGGTDLMVKRRNWAGLAPQFKNAVMLVSSIRELDYVKAGDGRISVGAATVLEDLLDNKDIPMILKQAVREMASPGIRHTATLAGNIGNASPAGDSLPVLYILNASVTLGSMEEERIVPIEDFITGPGSKSIQPNEMIKEITMDQVDFDYVYYKKVGGRKSDAISKISFAGAVSAEVGMVTDMRFAFGAVAPTIVRSKDYERRFKSSPSGDLGSMKDMVWDLYEPGIQPINDQRSTAVYRKGCARNILGEFLKEAERHCR